jgi:hypothetical protein
MGTQLEFTITTLVIGLLRQVVVQRCRRADVDLVLRGPKDGVAAYGVVEMSQAFVVTGGCLRHHGPSGACTHRSAQ